MNVSIVVNDLPETPVIIDEFEVEIDADANDEDESSSSSSSSGSSVEILTMSQLRDPDSEMQVVSPVHGCILRNASG